MVVVFLAEGCEEVEALAPVDVMRRIGMDALLAVVCHPVLSKLPFYLETPLDDKGHAEEIKRIRERMGKTR